MPTRKIVSMVIACSALLVWSGCKSARQEVKPSVLLLIDNIQRYDEAIKIHVDQENEYYRGLQRALREGAGRAAIVDQGNRRVAAIEQYVDKLLLKDKAVSVTDMKEFLKRTDSELNALVAAKRIADAEVNASAQANFKRLNDSRKELHRIQGELMQIVRAPSVKEQVKWWIDYGKNVEKQYKEVSGKAEPKTD